MKKTFNPLVPPFDQIPDSTSEIADSTDKRYVTDAELTVIGNTSGANTGDQDLSGYELLSNKATDFSTVNNTLYPTVQAVNTAINTATTGLLDYRGSYDASTNLFPATGGSGLLGAVLKGDFWICSVTGTLGSVVVAVGDLIIAINDTPGQTASNWDLIEHDVGYVPENVANKDTDGTLAGNSDTKYASQKATKTYADTKTTLATVNAQKLSVFAATSSAELAGVISDETGTNKLVYSDSPTLVTPILGTPTSATLTNATGLPVAGITASTSTALGVGSVELGHATDTTISRVSSGKIAVEGVNVVTTSSTDTLTNKTLTSPVITTWDGWQPYTAVTPTTGTFDAPSYPIVFAGVDLSAVLYPGMRVKITQSTDKYFIITKVSFSTDTTVTLYGGTDYSLVASGTTAISAFSYSSIKLPNGFSADPAKWSVTLTDTSNRTQASPVTSTVYNPGSLSITAPIGVWLLKYEAVCVLVSSAAQTLVNARYELSTSASALTDLELRTFNVTGGASATLYSYQSTGRQKYISLTSKQTYYLICENYIGSLTSIGFRGDLGATKAWVICAYL